MAFRDRFGADDQEVIPPGREHDGGRDLGSNMPALPAGTFLSEIRGGVITARKVEVRRDVPGILATMRTFAAMAGEDYYYSWEVKKRDGSKELIEGPSIVLALDLARTWGNCSVDVVCEDGREHWVFYARFCDYETGFSLTRAFQQRKSQTPGGKMGADRAADMAFQIGQSKAIRNVVVNALQNLALTAMGDAQNSIVAKVGKDLPKSRGLLVERLKEIGVDPLRVERVMARKIEEMVAPEIMQVIGTIRSVKDGMLSAADAWPAPEPEKPEAGAPQPQPEDFREKAAQAPAQAVQTPNNAPAKPAGEQAPPAAQTRPATAAPAQAASAAPAAGGQDEFPDLPAGLDRRQTPAAAPVQAAADTEAEPETAQDDAGTTEGETEGGDEDPIWEIIDSQGEIIGIGSEKHYVDRLAGMFGELQDPALIDGLWETNLPTIEKLGADLKIWLETKKDRAAANAAVAKRQTVNKATAKGKK